MPGPALGQAHRGGTYAQQPVYTLGTKSMGDNHTPGEGGQMASPCQLGCCPPG